MEQAARQPGRAAVAGAEDDVILGGPAVLLVEEIEQAVALRIRLPDGVNRLPGPPAVAAADKIVEVLHDQPGPLGRANGEVADLATGQHAGWCGRGGLGRGPL